MSDTCYSMTTYAVAWLIDIDADTPDAAARRALAIQRDPDSIAVVFGVTEPNGSQHNIDLLAGNDDGPQPREQCSPPSDRSPPP